MTKNERKEMIKNYCRGIAEIKLSSTCESLGVDTANFLKCKTTLEKMNLVKEAMTKAILEVILKDEVQSGK